MKYENLFESTQIGNVKIKNRFFMAPMFPFGLSDGSGITTRRYSDYYVERAKGGVGLIITGLCRADNTTEIMRPVFACVDDPAHYLQSTTPMIERIHAFGSKVFLQISAGWGRNLWPVFAKRLVSVDANVENRHEAGVMHEQLTTEEVETMVKGFAKTALVAKMAGFDGVEVHALHEGYLLDQFGTEFFNHRTDKYGGSFENRYRFAIEIIQSIKKVCGEDFAVSLRYSPKHFMRGLNQGAIAGEDFVEVGRDLEEGIKAAKYLVENGYDALNVDVGCYDSHYWNHPTVFSEDGLYLPFAKAIRDAVDVPVLCAGRMDDPEVATKAIADGKCDMIGLGRTLLADPYYPLKLQTGHEENIRWCLNCNVGCGSKILQIAHLGCAVNPQCAYESEDPLAAKIAEKKNMVIVGGGPGGMVAALTAAHRGFNVILLEKGNELGGNLLCGSKADFKYRDEKLIAYYKHQLDVMKVDVRMNTEATAEMLNAMDIDVLILATGASPVRPNIKGNENLPYLSASEALSDITKVGEKVVIVGGGQVGTETGIWLGQKGKTVTIVEALGGLQRGSAPQVQWHGNEIIRNMDNVTALTNTMVKEISANGVEVEAKDGEKSMIEADTVIYSVGYRSDASLYEQFARSGLEVYNIGDSDNVSHVYNAVHTAYKLVNRLV